MRTSVRLFLLAALVLMAGSAFADYAEAPKVVSLYPEDGAAGVPMKTEIRIQFDQPMDPNTVYLSFTGDDGGETFYLKRDDYSYNEDEKTFVFPMTLLPKAKYEVTTGEDFGHFVEGFKSRTGVFAQKHKWAFTTEDITPEGAKKPKLVRVTPEPGSTVPQLAIIKLEFDQPMMVQSIVMKTKEDGPGRSKVAMLPIIPETYKTTIEAGVYFPEGTNESESFGFYELRNADGVVADPVVLQYKVGKETFAQEIQDAIEAAKKDESFREILTKIKTTAENVRSLSETVSTVTEFGIGGRFNKIQATPAMFKMQGQDRFVGDIGNIVKVPFIVGADGENGWFYFDGPDSPPEVQSVNLEEIAEKNISICNPMGLKDRSVEDIIENENLIYAGKESGFHEFVSYEASCEGLSVVLWTVDAESLLLDRVDNYYSVGVRTVCEFTYDSLGVDLPGSAFAPPETQDTVMKEADPLDSDYDRRFITIDDGSDGRMSVRWGRKGPKGTISGGLN